MIWITRPTCNLPFNTVAQVSGYVMRCRLIAWGTPIHSTSCRLAHMSPAQNMGIELRKVVGDVGDELLCAGCNQLLYQPKVSNCGHYVCSNCLEKVTTKTKPRCLTCRQPLSQSSDVSEVPDELSKKLGAVSVQCILGCEVVVQLSELAEHTESECEYRIVRCVNRGCSQQCPVRNLDAHLLQCDFRLIRCEVCGACIAKRDMAAHQAVKRCYEQQLKRKRVTSARRFSQELKEHRVDIDQERHLTDQAERKLVRDHYERQKTDFLQRRRTQSAGPLSLTRSIEARVGSALIVPRYSRNLSVATATPLSCFGCENKFLSGRRPSARSHSHAKVYVIRS